MIFKEFKRCWAAMGVSGRLLTVVATGLLALGLTGCGGGGKTHDPFVPGRIIAMGDNLAVNTNNARYSVNVTTGEIMTMAEQVAASYGLSTVTAFISVASPNARVDSATSFASATSLTSQIANYSNPIAANDLFILSAGTVDVIDVFRYGSGSVTTAASRFVSAVQTLIGKGAKRIVVVPPYDLSITPWGKSLSTGNQAALKALVTSFRDNFKAGLYTAGVDGRVVVYADIELEMNLVINNNSLNLTNRTDAICDPATTSDPADGIGLGANEINSKLCTSSTLLSGATVSAYAFADKIYPTPVVHRSLGSAVYNASASR